MALPLHPRPRLERKLRSGPDLSGLGLRTLFALQGTLLTNRSCDVGLSGLVINRRVSAGSIHPRPVHVISSFASLEQVRACCIKIAHPGVDGFCPCYARYM